MILALHILDIFLFTIFAINIIYLFVFSVASLWRQRGHEPDIQTYKRIAILIPAYKEDAVIEECADSCLAQNYPQNMYDVVVISDRMSVCTNRSLQAKPLKLINIYFTNSTKSKALNHAMDQLEDPYDLALILDADNTISPDFLSQINAKFSTCGVEIVQAHRCAKNTNTPLALLDAVSEEINNSIFRQGHVNLGLSAALIGSGMCFDYTLFKTTMLSINAIGGFDRALELVLLRDGKRIYYMPESDVLDEKVQHPDAFSRQRRRWLSAQWHYLASSLKYVPEAIAHGRWDFCDKMFQQMSIPRIMLLGFSAIISLAVTFIDTDSAIKWWAIFGLLIFALLIAIPKRLFGKKLLIAVIQLPYFFALMALNIFRLKGANKKFIHTSHGVKK